MQVSDGYLLLNDISHYLRNIVKDTFHLMRLTKDKIENLKSSIGEFLPSMKVYLFGSRVDDSKKGGDIDILILADRALEFKEKSHIKWLFFNRFGEQKLDLISFSYDDSDPFKSVALMSAIEL